MNEATEQRKSISSPIPILGPAEVHVWTCDLDHDSQASSLEYLLSSDERDRAARFRFDEDRRRFTAARVFLRRLLGAYTGTDAAQLRFRYSEHGKPSLEFPASHIRFNLSHSDALAVVAVTNGREIGIDVEKIKNDIEAERLAERFFSACERDTLRSLPAEAKVAAFFRAWTCKEAFVKAQGMGLSLPLDAFDVELNLANPAALLATRPHDDAPNWSLRLIKVGAGYAAALALNGPISAVTTFDAKSVAALLT